MRKRAPAHVRNAGKNAAPFQDPFRIAVHLGTARNQTGFAGSTDEPPIRLWDAWRYAYPAIRPATQTLLIE
ncbi:MAG: hypothetical protein JO015_05625 [Verrucomicrobia bacterium]|nr:hypothetical protein [Verrucomicrobiota bacterium]